MKTISIVVPCYNEEECILLFDQEIKKEITKLPGYQFELLFIDDGSSDKTLSLIKSLQKENNCVIRYISFSRNFGKEAALYAGLVNAKGDYVAVMDVDLQDPPELLGEMIGILEAGEYDCVSTRRSTRKGEPILRSFCAKFFYKFINRISKTEFVDGARDFRLMTRRMVNAILSMTEKCRFSKGIFSWVGFKTYWISYENKERAAGKTKWNMWQLLKYSFEGIVDFSQSLLTFSSVIGSIILVLSLVSLVFIIVRKLVCGDPVQGWASTVSIILFIGGVQLLCISVLGLYLGRVYNEVKNRPIFIVSESSDEDVNK